MKDILMCITIFLMVVLLYLLLIMPRITGRPDMTPFLRRMYAHRGLHDNEGDAPENSMAAFKKAIDAGFGIELDVQLTKDKVPVIFHDMDLKRICGVDEKVANYTYEELQQFTLCKSQEHIPRLQDFLELNHGQVPFILEYKIQSLSAEVCAVANPLLEEYDGLYCIESFGPPGVLWYHRKCPYVVRGLLAENFIKDKEEMPTWLSWIMQNLLLNFVLKPDFIAYKHQYTKSWSRRLCRSLYKLPAAAWTIKSEEQLRERFNDYDMFIFDSFVPSEEILKEYDLQ